MSQNNFPTNELAGIASAVAAETGDASMAERVERQQGFATGAVVKAVAKPYERISLAQVQAQLARRQVTNTSSKDGITYPLYKIPFNATAVVRLLPNGDPDGNPDGSALPYAKRYKLKLKLKGMIHSEYDTDQDVEVEVPCELNWGKPSRIDERLKANGWWKSDKTLALKYYRKEHHIYQGLLVSSPFDEASAPSSPIRRFDFTYQAYNAFEAAYNDPDMVDAPYDYIGGRDLKVVKEKNGEFPYWGNCAFSFKTRPLSQEELDLVAKHGLRQLDDDVGDMPSAEVFEAVFDLFLDSLAGKPFDNAKYGPFFKAYEVRAWGSAPGGSTRAPVVHSAAALERSADTLSKLGKSNLLNSAR
jgi:hypothetical protein